MSNTSQKSVNVQFLTISEFKSLINKSAEKAEVIKNPHTGKLFLSIGSVNYKCQQDIDGAKEMKMFLAGDDVNEACLINVKPQENNVVFSL